MIGEIASPSVDLDIRPLSSSGNKNFIHRSPARCLAIGVMWKMYRETKVTFTHRGFSKEE